MRVRQMRSQSDPLQVGQLPDGTPFFAPLGELVRDGDERVQCHLCGRFMRIVGGTHIRVGHGWTLDAYREAFRLPEHEPTCAVDLSSRFRSDARARVGTKGFASPPADPPRRPKRTPAWRSLRNLRPDLAAELHSTRNGDLDADTLSAGSRRKVWWACSTCGHEWEAIVGNRTLRGSGCPVCSLSSAPVHKAGCRPHDRSQLSDLTLRERCTRHETVRLIRARLGRVRVGPFGGSAVRAGMRGKLAFQRGCPARVAPGAGSGDVPRRPLIQSESDLQFPAVMGAQAGVPTGPD